MVGENKGLRPVLRGQGAPFIAFPFGHKIQVRGGRCGKYRPFSISIEEVRGMKGSRKCMVREQQGQWAWTG